MGHSPVDSRFAACSSLCGRVETESPRNGRSAGSLPPSPPPLRCAAASPSPSALVARKGGPGHGRAAARALAAFSASSTSGTVSFSFLPSSCEGPSSGFSSAATSAVLSSSPPLSSNAKGGGAGVSSLTATTATVQDVTSCQVVTASPQDHTTSPVVAAPPGSLRSAKRTVHPSVPADRPSKRLRQQSMRQFLQVTHVVQTPSSTSVELRPIRRNRKRKRTSLIDSASLASSRTDIYRRSAAKLKKPRTAVARVDTDTDINQTVLRQDSEPPKGTDCLGANFPT